MRPAVLTQAAKLKDVELAATGEDYLDDSDETSRLMAHIVAMEDSRRGPSIALHGVYSADINVRLACIEKMGVMGPSDSVDAALLNILASDQRDTIINYACVSYVKRHGQDGARRVYHIVKARGVGYQVVAAQALAMFPSPEFRPTFVAAIESGVYATWGQRGLRAIGGGERESAGDEREIGGGQGAGEYVDAWQAWASARGCARRASFGSLSEDMLQGDIVLLGEVHMDPFVRAAELQVMGFASALWKGLGRMTVVYETKCMQGWVEGLASDMGFSVVESEPELLSEHNLARQSVEKRDAVAVACIEEACVGGAKSIVIYGAAHTVVLERELRMRGKRVLHIVLASDAMRAAAMRCEGTMDVHGKLFCFSDGTYYLAAQPLASWGCPLLDKALDDRNGGSARR